MITKVIAFFTSLLFVNNIFAFHISIGTYYFVIIFTILLIEILRSNFRLKFSPSYLLLITVITLSIIVNDVPSFFRPYERLLAFSIIIFTFSPALKINTLISLRDTTLNYFINWISTLTILSTLTLISGIYLGLPDRPDYTGLFSHSMILGPMSGISALNFAYAIEKNQRKGLKILFLLLLLLSILACVASGSRIALISTMVGLFSFYSYSYTLYKYKLFTRLFSLLILLVISYPLWKTHANFLQAKFEFSESKGDLLFSRNDIWQDRITEFSKSPIIGIGFASVDTRISEEFDEETGIVEPGSSWLAILSMTGLLGFIVYGFILFRPLLWLLKSSSKDLENSFLLSLLVLFFTHMFAEGYILSAGSGMLLFLITLLSKIDYKRFIYEIQK